MYVFSIGDKVLLDVQGISSMRYYVVVVVVVVVVWVVNSCISSRRGCLAITPLSWWTLWREQINTIFF